MNCGKYACVPQINNIETFSNESEKKDRVANQTNPTLASLNSAVTTNKLAITNLLGEMVNNKVNFEDLNSAVARNKSGIRNLYTIADRNKGVLSHYDHEIDILHKELKKALDQIADLGHALDNKN